MTARAEYVAHVPEWILREQPPFECVVCGHRAPYAMAVRGTSPVSAFNSVMVPILAFEQAIIRHDVSDVCGWCCVRLELA